MEFRTLAVQTAWDTLCSGQPFMMNFNQRLSVPTSDGWHLATENVQLLFTSLSSPPILPGHPWLLQHDSLISWTQNDPVGPTCQETCLWAMAGTCSKAPNVELDAIPPHWCDLAEVFHDRQAVEVPP